MLEDRLDLEPQLLLRERNEPGGFMDRPLLPGPAIQPDLRARSRDGIRRAATHVPIVAARGLRITVAARVDVGGADQLQRSVDGLLAHAMRAMRIGQIAGD